MGALIVLLVLVLVLAALQTALLARPLAFVRLVVPVVAKLAVLPAVLLMSQALPLLAPPPV